MKMIRIEFLTNHITQEYTRYTFVNSKVLNNEWYRERWVGDVEEGALMDSPSGWYVQFNEGGKAERPLIFTHWHILDAVKRILERNGVGLNVSDDTITQCLALVVNLPDSPARFTAVTADQVVQVATFGRVMHS